jgi:hypothetical protein
MTSVRVRPPVAHVTNRHCLAEPRPELLSTEEIAAEYPHAYIHGGISGPRYALYMDFEDDDGNVKNEYGGGNLHAYSRLSQ